MKKTEPEEWEKRVEEYLKDTKEPLVMSKKVFMNELRQHRKQAKQRGREEERVKWVDDWIHLTDDLIDEFLEITKEVVTPHLGLEETWYVVPKLTDRCSSRWIDKRRAKKRWKEWLKKKELEKLKSKQ